MPQNVRDYLFAALLGATPVLLIAGAVAFWNASSFQGYIAALMVFTLAACSFFGARELKPTQPTDLRSLADYFTGKKTRQDAPYSSTGSARGASGSGTPPGPRSEERR